MPRWDVISGLQNFNAATHGVRMAKRIIDDASEYDARRKRQKVLDYLQSNDAPDQSVEGRLDPMAPYKRTKFFTVSQRRVRSGKMVRSYRRRSSRFPRRRVGRRRRSMRRFRRIPPSLAIGPRNRLLRFRAVTYNAFTCTSGALDSTIISGNSLYDPFQADGAGQPYGLDEWGSFYNRYAVIGAKISVKFHNNGTPTLMCGITAMPPNKGTALTAYAHYMETPRTRSVQLSSDLDSVTLASRMSIKKLCGVHKILDNTYQTALLTSNPSTQPWFHVWVQPLDASTTGAAQAVITVEYLAVLYDAKMPGRS